MIYTYQTYLESINRNQELDFIWKVVSNYRASKAYKEAAIAHTYMDGENYTISRYQKFLATNDGDILNDVINPNYKLKTKIFKKLVIQRSSFLVGNGVNFTKKTSKKKYGEDIDQKIYELLKESLVGGSAFGFWNYDHLEVFSRLEFIPLYDEYTGKLRAGLRIFRLDGTDTTVVSVYREDGTYEVEFRNGKPAISKPLTGYIATFSYVKATDETTVEYENYNALPIIELEVGSLLKGLREQIDCYDLIKSGFANDLDKASQIYWILENCGGMDDLDVARFLRQVKNLGAAVVDGDDGATAEAHTIEVPYNSREIYLNILKKDIYDDAMALDTSVIQAGNITATQIKAAYEPLNEACDELEFKLDDFFLNLNRIIGVSDTPIFNRSYISNQEEQTNMVLAAKDILPKETIIKHLPFLTVDEVEELISKPEVINNDGV